MRKILVPLLVLALLLTGISALAEGSEPITLQLNSAKLPLYSGDAPILAELGATGEVGSGLDVLLLQVKKSYTLQVTVLPKNTKNKKVTITSDNPDVVKVKGSALAAGQPGEAVVTITSDADPSATLQYKVLVYQQMTSMKVAAPAKSVAAGQSMTLSVTCNPANATLQKVTWSSANEAIATVDENGTVTGVARGNARIIADSADGSGVRANISVTVTQNAEQITLDKEEMNVDITKTGVLKATVLPTNTNDKAVVWSTSDAGVATVNAQGRVTGVALGDCEITCASKTDGNILAKAVVHVLQPVKQIVFGEAPAVYAGETGVVTWSVQPDNASNPAIAVTSQNEKILTVTQEDPLAGQATITGIKSGSAFISAASLDGSKRQTRLKIQILQHVTGVHMKRETAYVDVAETATAGAVLEPKDASNHNMTWSIDDTAVATVAPVAKDPSRVKITGVRDGITTLRGVTEDGGFEATMKVWIADWSHMSKITDAYIDGKGGLHVTVRNIDDEFPISQIKIQIEAYDQYGNEVSVNTKDGSNKFFGTYSKSIAPGRHTPDDQWVFKDYNKDIGFQWMVIHVTEYKINGDWVKVLKQKYQPKYSYKP